MTPAKGAIMNNVKKTIASAKSFVSDHKTAITVTVTAAATTVACVAFTRALKNGYVETVNEFLAEKGLTDEFTALLDDVN
jgi:phage terminase large subunit-like protein